MEWSWETTGRLPNLLLQAGEIQTYFANGFATTSAPEIVFSLSESTTSGIYVGKSLQNQGMAQVAIAKFVSLINGSE